MSDILDISGRYISEIDPVKKQLIGEVKSFDSTKLNRVQSVPIMCTSNLKNVEKPQEMGNKVPNCKLHIDKIYNYQKFVIYRKLNTSLESGIIVEFKSPMNKRLYYHMYKIGYIIVESQDKCMFKYNIYPNESCVLRFIYWCWY